MTLADTFTELPDQLFDAISTAQEVVLSALQALAETTKPIMEQLPQMPSADQLPDPASILENAFAAAEKVLANQKEFSMKLMEAFQPPKPAAKPARSTKAA